jgi:hypothetical protein
MQHGIQRQQLPFTEPRLFADHFMADLLLTLPALIVLAVLVLASLLSPKAGMRIVELLLRPPRLRRHVSSGARQQNQVRFTGVPQPGP